MLKSGRFKGRAGNAPEPFALALLGALSFLAPAACTEDLRLPPSPSATGGRSGRGGDEGGGRGGTNGERDAASAEVPQESCRYLNNVEQQTPQVIIALDRSSSMFKTYGTATVTRLQILQQTLRTLLKTYGESVHFGYVDFPVKVCPTGCCASQIIPPNPQTLTAIEKRWGCELQPVTCGQTTDDSPAGQALREARWLYEDEETWPASRHVLLLTDGEPMCKANMAHNDCSMAVNEIGRLSGSHKVTSRVYGLSEELRGSACLDMMATLGGAASQGQPASHRITTTGEQLFDELSRWLDTLSGEACSFRLPDVLTAGQRVTVRHDRRLVPQRSQRRLGVRRPRRAFGGDFLWVLLRAAAHRAHGRDRVLALHDPAAVTGTANLFLMKSPPTGP